MLTKMNELNKKLMQYLSTNRTFMLMRKQPGLWGITACLVGGLGLASFSLLRIAKKHPEVLIRREPRVTQCRVGANGGGALEGVEWIEYRKLFTPGDKAKMCPAPDF